LNPLYQIILRVPGCALTAAGCLDGTDTRRGKDSTEAPTASVHYCSLFVECRDSGLLYRFSPYALPAPKRERREPRKWTRADHVLSDPVKPVASANDTGRTGYSVKLSSMLTPGYDGLHR
jgi:hypothetical protein